MTEILPNLIGLDRNELAERLLALGVNQRQIKMRVTQLWGWLYQRGVSDFDKMTTLSKDFRELLKVAYSVERPEVVNQQVSKDGTRKWLLRIAPSFVGEKRHEIEMVYIPTSDRGTLCVSSQVGCTLNCTFCHTGTQTLVRNLSAAEILGQIMIAKDLLGDWPMMERPEGVFIPEGDGRAVTNIVMMGMGEPLYNFDNLKKALLIACDNEGISLSRRRVTLSTSGVVPMMEKAGAEIGVMLAVSLHATNDKLRDELVPINKKYNIEMLMDACRNYPGLTNAKRITFEYVMLKGVNDSDKEARALVQLLRGIPAKVNLIPFNPWPGTKYECSDWERIEKFGDILFEAGYSSPIRTPRGRDIFAACGQLKSETERLKSSEKEALRAMMIVD
jgi:23S rRNA (adenine2503-C2)-methyltransferase